jgi:hypothetical protein
MPPSSPEPLRSPVSQRFREALCLIPGEGLCPDESHSPGEALCRSGRNEQGNAVVEFTFLSLLLMVPLVYFIITMGQLQGGSFAVVGAADQAAKVYVAQPDTPGAQAAAEQAALIALADYGHPAQDAQVHTSCEPADCQAAGTAVTVTVSLRIPLPFVPFNKEFRLTAGEVGASATQLVGRFR